MVSTMEPGCWETSCGGVVLLQSAEILRGPCAAPLRPRPQRPSTPMRIVSLIRSCSLRRKSRIWRYEHDTWHAIHLLMRCIPWCPLLGQLPMSLNINDMQTCYINLTCNLSHLHRLQLLGRSFNTSACPIKLIEQ
jgi:hypothetical protein